MTSKGVSVTKATLFVKGIGSDICSPFFSAVGKLHVVRQSSGTIMSVDNSGNTQTICCTNGQPSGAAYNAEGILYVADFGHNGVLSMQQDGQQDMVVGVYEDKPLKGPSSISISSDDIYFTDSGSFGDTGLHSRTGSLFAIVNRILKPLSYESMAYPSGLAVSKNNKIIYVAEMMANRVLRFFQQPAGVYHSSVFHQFSGGVGPSCLAIDSNGNLFVGHYEVRDSGISEGIVSVLSPDGKLVSLIHTSGPEISGLTINEGVLYITEKSTGSILKVKI